MENSLAALDGLTDNEDKHQLRFLVECRELTELVALRRERDLRGRMQGLTHLRSESEAVLKWLEEVSDEEEGVNYLEVFVGFYEQLKQMYQMVLVSSSSISKLKETNRALTR